MSQADVATIVLVDDDVLALEMLRDLVSSISGTAVRAFGRPEEALAWCRAHQPDLVITDHVMPGLTGLELIRTLRAGPDTADVPVMMITGTEDRGLRFRALESGASDVLGKPLDASEVLARTRNMLAIRRGQRLLAERSQLLENEVRRATAEVVAREQETILRLSRAAEYRDWETGTTSCGWPGTPASPPGSWACRRRSRSSCSGPRPCTTWERSACPTTSCSSPARSTRPSSRS